MTICITGAADVITAVSVLSLALKLRGWVEVLVVVSHELVGIMASAISYLTSRGQHEKCEQVKAVISGLGVVFCLGPWMPLQLCLAHPEIHCFYVKLDICS